MTTAPSTKHDRQWHYFSITVDFCRAEALSDELWEALKDYGIGILTTTPGADDNFKAAIAVCYSTVEDHEVVIGDLFKTITVALLDAGCRVHSIAITHELTEPHHDADAAFGADKFAFIDYTDPRVGR